MLDVPGGTTVWAWTSPEYPGFGRPRKPNSGGMEQRGDEPDEAWREITVREARGRAPTVQLPPGASPARNCGPSWTAAATTCPTLPRAQPWRLWPTWVGPGGALKRSSRLRRVTLDDTRPAAWHHHIAMCLLGGAFLLSLLGGKRCPGSRGHRCTGWCGRCCPGSSSGPINCCCGWRIRSYDERARRSHERRRYGAATLNPSL